MCWGQSSNRWFPVHASPQSHQPTAGRVPLEFLFSFQALTLILYSGDLPTFFGHVHHQQNWSRQALPIEFIVYTYYCPIKL